MDSFRIGSTERDSVKSFFTLVFIIEQSSALIHMLEPFDLRLRICRDFFIGKSRNTNLINDFLEYLGENEAKGVLQFSS
jgi:hypothetical protein